MPTENQFDSDSPWKEILEEYFPQFMSFFAPQAYQEIDWDKGYEFLDKEFQKIFPQSTTGRRYVDKLVKVYRLDGNEAYVIIHIEVQGDKDKDFEERMSTQLNAASQPSFAGFNRVNLQLPAFWLL